MATIKWIKYKEWSGVKINGTGYVPKPSNDLHIDRAAYLATALESPKMGAVQSYDRCGISGGPFHFTAIQPKNMVQGSLFQLLRYLEVAAPCNALQRLFESLMDEGWFVARDGKLRHYGSGALVSAYAIRNVFAPVDGKVPKTGSYREQADKWAELFHKLFSNPDTYTAQQEFAIEYLIKGQKDYETIFYAPYDILSLAVHEDANTHYKAIADISLDIDLALCVYHAHSVNAPGPAKNCLVATKNKFNTGLDRFGPDAARYLIWRLGRYKYGRWQDTTDGKNRYDYTRVHAMNSGLWPKEFFTGKNSLMPKDLGKSP